MMKRAIGYSAIALAIGLSLWLGSGCGRQSAQKTQMVEVRPLLNKDCGVGDPESLLATSQFSAMGVAALPGLWSALRFGPTPSERDTMEDYANQEYGRIKIFLHAGGLGGLAQADVRDSVHAITLDQYVGMQMESFILGYHQRALNALVNLSPSALNDSLTEIVLEPSLPLPIRTKIEDILGP
jgi:hypothetical protein